MIAPVSCDLQLYTLQMRYPLTLFVLVIGVCAQAGTIQGIVQDAEGKPIESVKVIVKGSSVGSNTNKAGIFRLHNVLAGNYTLVFTSVGYYSQEVAVAIKSNDMQTVHITMQRSEQQLEQKRKKNQPKNEREQALPADAVIPGSFDSSVPERCKERRVR